jgi:hypothetical protein
MAELLADVPFGRFDVDLRKVKPATAQSRAFVLSA